MTLQRLRVCILACVVLLLAASVVAQPISDNWIESPEAYFATLDERNEWWTLRDEAARTAFKKRYWARRDPTPDTERNEFREMVHQRIEVADKRFPVDTTKGSETSRGYVFILFGSPTRFKEDYTPRTSASPSFQSPSFYNEGNEVTSTWWYERSRNPKLLEMIDLPALEVKFVIEPTRRRDALQNPGLINKFRETLAAKSIVNPKAGPVIAADGMTAIDVLPGPALSERAAQLIDEAAAKPSSPVRSASTWRADGTPLTTLWVQVPVNATDLTVHARVKDSSGKQVAAVSRRTAPASGFTTSTGGGVVAVKLPLAPGSYEAAVAVERNQEVVASGVTNVSVPDTNAFGLSSLVLAHSPADAPGGEGGVQLGNHPLRPRADLTFSTSESLWYLFGVANPADAAKVTVRAMLRQGIKPPGAPVVVPASLQPIADGRFIGGFEVPLTALAPGDYTLYVTVTDGAGKEQMRRAEFRIAAPAGARIQ